MYIAAQSILSLIRHIRGLHLNYDRVDTVECVDVELYLVDASPFQISISDVVVVVVVVVVVCFS